MIYKRNNIANLLVYAVFETLFAKSFFAQSSIVITIIVFLDFNRVIFSHALLYIVEGYYCIYTEHAAVFIHT